MARDGLIGDHGERALLGDGLADVVAVVGRVGHDHRGRQVLDQGQGLGRITPVPRREPEADGAAQASDGQVDLGAQAAAGTAKSLPRT